jgi:acid phosphatase class B
VIAAAGLALGSLTAAGAQSGHRDCAYWPASVAQQAACVRAETYLAAAGHHDHGTGRPAVVFDIDDTLLNSYDHTLAEQFGYSRATNEIWVDNAAFPAVFYMPQLVRFAVRHGYAVFFITGRPQSQTAATIKDLTSAGYAAPQGATCSSSLQFRPPTCTAQSAELHDDRVQVRYPQAHLQRGLQDRR